jgi:hypothetical protein
MNLLRKPYKQTATEIAIIVSLGLEVERKRKNGREE